MSIFSPTFGVEIECYLPEGATSAQAAAAVSSRGVACHVQIYNHSVPTTWKVVTDGSLGDVARGIEFVSPPLSGEAGLAQVNAVCEALTDFGCTVSKRCGLHVHVNARGENTAFFRNLVKLYAAFEPVLDSIMPPSRRASNNSFCRSMTAARPSVVDLASNLDAIIVAYHGRSPMNSERGPLSQTQSAGLPAPWHRRVSPALRHRRRRQGHPLGGVVPAHGGCCPSRLRYRLGTGVLQSWAGRVQVFHHRPDDAAS